MTLAKGIRETRYVSKNLRTVKFGDRLSDREIEVLRGMSYGMTNPAIASVLHITTNSVKIHNQRIFRKLDARDRANAVSLGYQLGYLRAGSTATPTEVATWLRSIADYVQGLSQ